MCIAFRHFEGARPDIVGVVQAATHDPEAAKLLAEVIHKVCYVELVFVYACQVCTDLHV